MLPSLFVACALLGQAEATPQETRAAIGRWVQQLGAKELAARDAAEQALLEMGPTALDALPAGPEGLSAEVVERLGRIRPQLERQRAEAFLQGTKVTLDEQAAPLSEVLEALRQASGNALVDYREPFGQVAENPELRFGCEKLLYWRALDAVLDLAGLTVYGYSGEPGIALVARGEGEVARTKQASYAGAFRVAPLHFEAHRDLRIPDRSSLLLRLEVAWEPRIHPVAIRQPLRQLKLRGVGAEGEQPIQVLSPDGVVEATINPDAMLTELDLPLLPAWRGSQLVASLAGTLEVLLPGGVETFEFVECGQARRVEQRRGGARVFLDEVRKNNDLWEVRMRVQFDETSGALESHRTWIFDNEAFLKLPDGKRQAHDGFQTTVQNEEEVGVAYLFDRPEGLDGVTFVYRTPVVLVKLPVRYELHDLALP